MPVVTSPLNRPDLAAGLNAIRAKWGWFVGLGVALLVLGFVAAIHLVAATVVSVYYVGAIMLVGGIVQLIHAFRVTGWSEGLYWGLGGALYAAAGAIAFFNPLLASAVLTLILAASLVVSGLFRVWGGIKARPHDGWGWIVTGGVVTLLAGLVIAAGWPVNSLW
ncbi:MAG: HdeD family acid-resistance protein, partial [Ferrovibrionaceae bacterium]